MSNPPQILDAFSTVTQDCGMADYFSYIDYCEILEVGSEEEIQQNTPTGGIDGIVTTSEDTALTQSATETSGPQHHDPSNAPPNTASFPSPSIEPLSPFPSPLDGLVLLTSQTTPSACTRSSSVDVDKEKSTLQASARSRRQAQNRAAQRSFRDRKLKYVRELEDAVKRLTSVTSSLKRENEQMRSQLSQASGTSIVPLQLLEKLAGPLSPVSTPPALHPLPKASNGEPVTPDETWSLLRTYLLLTLLEAKDVQSLHKRLSELLGGQHRNV